MRTDLRTHMRHGLDARFRSAATIAARTGYALSTVQELLPEMERQGVVESRKAWGNVHGSKKVYRLTR